MEKVQIQTEIQIKQLLSQLKVEELEALGREIASVLSQRRSTTTHGREAELIRQLNEECTLSEAHWETFTALSHKREEGTITGEELNKLTQLTQEEEGMRLKRIHVLGELAQLKGISLMDMSKKLGIKAL